MPAEISLELQGILIATIPTVTGGLIAAIAGLLQGWWSLKNARKDESQKYLRAKKESLYIEIATIVSRLREKLNSAHVMGPSRDSVEKIETYFNDFRQTLENHKGELSLFSSHIVKESIRVLIEAVCRPDPNGELFLSDDSVFIRTAIEKADALLAALRKELWSP